MSRAGKVPVPPNGRFFNRMHGLWSEFAHHRRRHIVNQVAGPLRLMITGPHPDWRARAVVGDHFGDYVVELVIVGGRAVHQALDGEWHARFQETIGGLLKLKEEIALEHLATNLDSSSDSGRSA